MGTRRPARLRSFSYRGKYQYFLTFCTRDRRSVFDAPEPVECVRSEIVRTCQERGFAAIAMVFMPDHLHMLVAGTEERAHLISCVTLMRQRSAIAFRKNFHDGLWQDGYFDHVVRDADDARRILAYIAGNPVKATLCARAEDYPFLFVTPE